MPIVQQGALNTTALVVPDLYVQIVPPKNLYLNGAPTDIIGVVGSASWGPANVGVIVGSMADYAQSFGPVMARKYDMGTQVATAVQQGAADFRCVRVTDGTDTTAVAVFNFTAPAAWQAGHPVTAFSFYSSDGAVWQALSGGMTGATAPNPAGVAQGGTFSDGTIGWRLVTLGGSVSSAAVVALYTGSTGDQIVSSLVAGSAAGTWKFVVAFPGAQPEVFDNISTTSPTGIFWENLQIAVNFGQSAYGRGPSQYVMITGGGGGNAGAAPTVSSTWNGTNNAIGIGGLTGMIAGTDGALGVTAATLVGVDTMPRRGMYALRSLGCSVGVLADADDATQWTTQLAFGLAEGVYMVLTGPTGDTITNAVAAKATAGLDGYGAKIMFGDWVWWNDQANGLLRLVSPQGFIAGRLGNLSPEQSTLNKPLYSVVGTQRSGAPGSSQVQTYSTAELQELIGAGFDVIANPEPGGKYWGARSGHNSSSNPSTNGDNYTRLTNYIAATLSAGMGLYVGQVINADLFDRIKATQIAFLQALLSQGILGSVDGSLPFGVICDLSNNPHERTSLGYVQSDAQIQYQAINEKFIVNIEGGQTVTVTRQTLASGQAA